MNKNTKLAIASLLVSLIVLALKTKAYYVTQSVSVLSDALETVINVVTALVALYAIHFASKPADDDHPYGHGKLEYFSAAFEGGLIFFAAIAIIVKAVDSFFRESLVTNIMVGNTYLIVATIINLMAGIVLVFTGKKINLKLCVPAANIFCRTLSLQ